MKYVNKKSPLLNIWVAEANNVLNDIDRLIHCKRIRTLNHNIETTEDTTRNVFIRTLLNLTTARPRNGISRKRTRWVRSPYLGDISRKL